MKRWAELSVASQVKRIRRALAAALPRWGLAGAKLHFIFHGENTTFRAVQRGRSYLVRVARPGYHTVEETLSELAWLEALSADTGCCPRPVRARDGELVVALDSPDVFASHVCVFEWMHGRILGKRLGAASVRGVGELMARFHRHAADWAPPPAFERPDCLRMTGRAPDAETRQAWQFLPDAHRREFELIRNQAFSAYETISGPNDIGLLHADLHSRNVLVTPQGLAAIDFDDAGYAPWVTDMAVTAAFWTEQQRDRFQALLEGYSRVREVPGSQLVHLPVLIAWRLAGVCLWVTARAQNNASFRARLGSIQKHLLTLARDAMARDYS